MAATIAILVASVATFVLAAAAGYAVYFLVSNMLYRRYEAESDDAKRAFAPPPDLRRWSGGTANGN